MTFSIKVSDASFSNFAAEVPPHIELAQMLCIFGGTEAASLRNYAGTRAAATKVGTPTYSAGYATVSGTANGFEAPMAAGKSPFTHILVTSLLATSNGYCGNWVTGTTANLLTQNSGDVNLAVDSNLRVGTPMSGAGFHFIAGSHNGTTANVYHGSGGVNTKASVSYTGGAVTTGKFRVGASGFGTSAFNVAAVMTFNSYLSDAYILDIYGYMTRMLAARGVTVL